MEGKQSSGIEDRNRFRSGRRNLSEEQFIRRALPEDADFDLLSEFVAESGDLISDAEEALLTLETNPEDEEAVGTIFRAFHTVKGVSAFYGTERHI